jgi:hemerythrin-like domain-containing protein
MNATPASDSLRADHRKIEGLLDPLLEALLHLTPAGVNDVRRHFQEIQRLTAPHFKREEGVFYPAIRDKDPSMLARMDEQHADTRQIEAFLQELLDSLPPTPGERDLKELHWLGIQFHDAVQTHILDEEDHLLALADRVLSAAEQDRVLVRMNEDVVGGPPAPLLGL